MYQLCAEPSSLKHRIPVWYNNSRLLHLLINSPPRVEAKAPRGKFESPMRNGEVPDFHGRISGHIVNAEHTS